LKYAESLKGSERNSEMVQKAKERLELHRKDLSDAGISYTREQSLKPYKK
jgi:hypothetical protein